MIKLGKRLTSLVDCIEGESVADIGTDHGKVVVHAILTGKAQRAVAADISKKCLEKAMALAESYGVEIDFAVSDGLQNLPYITDSIIIAGMGGREIVSILKNSPNGNALDLTSHNKKPVTFILMPHQDSWILRNFLAENRVKIKKDTVVKDGEKYYDLIVASASENKEKIFTETEIFTGKNSPVSRYYKDRLLARNKVLKKILDTANDKAADQIKKEAAAVMGALQDITEETGEG